MTRELRVYLIAKGILFFPFVLPTIVMTIFVMSYRKKELLKLFEDGQAFINVMSPYGVARNNIFRLYSLFLNYREFRSLTYLRIGYISELIKWILPGQIALFIRVPSENIGGGIFIQHEHSTRIGAKSIGKNLFINQNVTKGWKGKGLPIIGDNVRIGSGAVILGNVKIGNNVKIGANAIVVKSIPDNCTVVSPQAYICKRNGITVNEPL